MVWCCVEPERVAKSTLVMEAVAQGFYGTVCVGEPPDDGEPVFVWGQLWTAEALIPKMVAQKRPFIQIDNGYVDPTAGRRDAGYYRLCVNGLSAGYCADAPTSRISMEMKPWRPTRGSSQHIVLAIPGQGFGRAMGWDMPAWSAWAVQELPSLTTRRIITRRKEDRTTRPLAQDLDGAWALVTHSSNVAVDAVLEGVPVFVAPTSPCAPVGRRFGVSVNDDLEAPWMGDRTAWFNSLMAQQFTLGEIRSGLAREYMQLFTKDF